MRHSIYLLLISLALFSCGEKKGHEGHEHHDEAGQEAASTTSTSNTFGVKVSTTESITLAALEQKMTSLDSASDITLSGKVAEVCTKKGCWMTIAKEDGSTVRVTFKDYALFMPSDIKGKQVVLHGMAKKKEVSVDELKHFAEDQKKPQAEIDAINAPEKQLTFEADGVEIVGS